MYNVGSHPIVEKYDQGPRLLLRDALSTSGVPWTSIDVVRFGYEEDVPRLPVVVMVTVEPRSRTHEAGATAVSVCQTILDEHGLNDVHVIIKEGARPKTYQTTHEDDADVVLRQIPFAGAGIGPVGSDEPGTLGFYATVTPKDAAPYTCAVTCQHVVSAGLQTEGKILAPSTADLLRFEDAHSGLVREWQDQIEALTEKAREAEEGLRKPLNEKQMVSLQEARQQHKEEEKVLANASKVDRSFGTVVHAEGVYTSAEHGNSVDWAVIRPDSRRVAATNDLPPIPLNFLMAAARQTNKTRVIPFAMDPSITGTLPFSSITHPQTTDSHRGPCLIVLKHGRTTGWQAGRSNEVRSDCRWEDGGVTKEWCILDISDEIALEGGFSRPGDSGAPVVDLEGRLIGMLHSGAGRVTWATPLERLVESMETALEAKVEVVVSEED